MKQHLTEIAVRSLKSSTTIRVWDTQTKGFGVSVGGNKKSWIVRVGDKRTVRKLGCYPTMSLADARAKAKKALIEPIDESPNVSVEDTFAEFEETHGAQNHGERMRYETRRLFNTYVLPTLGHKRLSQLTAGLIRGILPTERPSEANHLFRTVRTFLNWCVRRRYLTTNPLGGEAQPSKEKSRDRVLSPEEIKTLWTTATGQYGTIWKLLLLTGQRRSQILSLEWEWIPENAIEFPAHIMKNKKPHIVPLGGLVRATLPPRDGRYVFPSSKGGHTSNLSKQKIEHDGDMKPYVLHDLRRTFASIHASIGTPIHIIEKLLNHVSGQLSGVAGIYNRYSYIAEMRVAVQKYEDHLKSIVLAGRQPEGRHDDPPTQENSHAAHVEEEGCLPFAFHIAGHP